MTRGMKVEIVMAEVQGFQHIIIPTHHASMFLRAEFLRVKSSLLFWSDSIDLWLTAQDTSAEILIQLSAVQNV